MGHNGSVGNVARGGVDFRGLARVGVGEPEVPLLAVVSHRPDGRGRYDDVGHDGVCRWR